MLPIEPNVTGETFLVEMTHVMRCIGRDSDGLSATLDAHYRVSVSESDKRGTVSAGWK